MVHGVGHTLSVRTLVNPYGMICKILCRTTPDVEIVQFVHCLHELYSHYAKLFTKVPPFLTIHYKHSST
jgi:hypothetical protein